MLNASALALIGLLAFSVSTAAWASEDPCYDLKVRAKPIAQIPTVYVSDDPDVIVISWPWFLDLRIKRVLEGDAKKTSVTTLAVMHSSFVSKTRTWLLRRNSVGTFNVIRSATPDSIPRCEPGVAPAKPYITPPPGKTYADLRREGEAEYLEEGAS